MSFSTPVSGTVAVERDALLVRRSLTGDEAAFEGLYRRHVGRIHSLVRRMTSPDRADEVTQDVFVRAWRKLASFRGESAFGTWLHRLAVNVALTDRRRERSRNGWLHGDDEVLQFIGTTTAHPGVSLDLESAIARLPVGARQVFVLHDIEGWKHEEIANRLGVAPGTSKSQLSRARQALRRMLDGY